jgi:hypothetical protein
MSHENNLVTILVVWQLMFGELINLQSFFFKLSRRSRCLINFEILMQSIGRHVMSSLYQNFRSSPTTNPQRHACHHLPEFSVEPQTKSRKHASWGQTKKIKNPPALEMPLFSNNKSQLLRY